MNRIMDILLNVTEGEVQLILVKVLDQTFCGKDKLAEKDTFESLRLIR